MSDWMPDSAGFRVWRTLALVIVLSAFFPGAAGARQPAAAAATPSSEPFQILDNSFLVEEAFNQPPGVFQNIFGAVRADGVWSSSFVQEWPVVSERHQLSYTLSWAMGGGRSGFGDTLINYRFQALTEGPRRPAFSPRLSVILPTGSEGVGYDAYGLQFNLPFSKQAGDFYFHWNVGMTWIPSDDGDEGTVSIESPFVSGSAIYRLAPMFHLMLETVGVFDEQPTRTYTVTKAFTASPGARFGWNVGDDQLIVGLAVPVTWTVDERRDTAAFVYVSYELPFKK